jgi:hypothetical protein
MLSVHHRTHAQAKDPPDRRRIRGIPSPFGKAYAASAGRSQRLRSAKVHWSHQSYEGMQS